MSTLIQRFGNAGGLVVFLAGVLILASALLGQRDAKHRITQRAGQWAELQQLGAHTEAGQEAALVEWLEDQGPARSFEMWLETEWKGSRPKLSPLEEGVQGSLKRHTLTCSFDRVEFTELFEFMYQLESFSEPPWRIIDIDMQAAAPGRGRARLDILAISAPK